MSKRKPGPARPAPAALPFRPPKHRALSVPEVLEIVARMLERLVEEIRALKTFT